MFGLSRLAHQFPDRTLGPLFWRAIGASWAIVMGPFVLVAGSSAAVPSVLAAGASMALGTLGFAASQPVRNAPQTMTRWLCQGTAAAITSALAWVIA
jgi:hypothetical protein